METETKGKTLELAISPDYVSSWGTWEAVREVLQNGIDRQTEGIDQQAESGELAQPIGMLDVSYHAKSRHLVVTSIQTTIPRQSLLLGVTTKTGSKTIGQYGEGYKLALVVLLRKGKKVEILNGKERWTPMIVESRDFGGEVLAIKIAAGPKDNEDLVFSIEGITPAEMKMIRKNCLRLGGTYEHFVTEEGEVLTGKNQERRLYVGGLYVCSMRERDKWMHGFNFNPGEVVLDRDRRLIAEWEVTYTAAKMFKQLDDPDALAALIEAEAEEVRSIYEYGGQTETTKKAADKVFWNFLERHGTGSLPARGEDERKALEKEYLGAKIVILSETVVKAIRISEAFKKYLEQFEARDILEPAAFLKKWIEDRKIDMSPKLLAAFTDEVLPVAEGWKL